MGSRRHVSPIRWASGSQLASHIAYRSLGSVPHCFLSCSPNGQSACGRNNCDRSLSDEKTVTPLDFSINATCVRESEPLMVRNLAVLVLPHTKRLPCPLFRIATPVCPFNHGRWLHILLLLLRLSKQQPPMPF